LFFDYNICPWSDHFPKKESVPVYLVSICLSTHLCIISLASIYLFIYLASVKRERGERERKRERERERERAIPERQYSKINKGLERQPGVK
jgi:uncharacterized membrane protein